MVRRLMLLFILLVTFSICASAKTIITEKVLRDEVPGEYWIEYRIPIIMGMEELQQEFSGFYEEGRERLIEMTGELEGVKHLELYEELDYEILVDTDEYLAIKIHFYGFYGGIHGFGGITIYSINPKTGERLGIEYFVRDKIEQVWRHLQAKADEIAKPNNWYFMYDIPPMEDEQYEFYVKDDVLHVIYNTYVIADYGQGAIEFEIPLAELDEEVELWDRGSAKNPLPAETASVREKGLWERISNKIIDFFRWVGAVWVKFWS